MLILTTEQMSFVKWESDLQGYTLAECLEIEATLALECAWMRMREGNPSRADVLMIESEHERELRANPALADCPDFRANIARLLAGGAHHG